MSDVHTHTPLLMEIDWASQWRELATLRNCAPDEKHWNSRAAKYPKSSKNSANPNSYVAKFLEFLNLDEDDCVFDMGCGNGALAIPIALSGHDVIAADFSSGMLDVLREEVAELGNLSIETIQMSWEDDWASYGVNPKSADVAIASRSICTDDIADSLARLDTVARKKCAVTLPLNTSPRLDPTILKEIGIDCRPGISFEYAFMILAQMGRLPEVRYIQSVKPNIFDDENDALDSIERMIKDAISPTSPDFGDIDFYINRGRKWALDNLFPVKSIDFNSLSQEIGEIGDIPKSLSETAVMFKIPRKVTWVYIEWKVD